MMTPNYIFPVLISLVLAFSSCTKFLEQEPANRISVDDIFKDFEGARTTLVGCYDNLKSFDYYLRDMYVYPELTGGNIKYSRVANQLNSLSFNFTNAPLENDLRGFYETAYKTLFAANNILTNLSNVQDASMEQMNRMLADAYTIRALVHFDLVRVFAQPYAFTADGSHQGITLRRFNQDITQAPAAPSTVKEVYSQVISDLDSAILLYETSVPIYAGGSEKTWLSADAAKALLTRVYLYQGGWDKVIELSSELIESGNYNLLTRSQYVGSWSRKNISRESIFELAYGIRTGGSFGDYFNPVSNSFQLAATNDLLDLFAEGDIRGKNDCFIQQAVSGTNYYFTSKYQGTSDSANNIKLFRSSELYLSRAEAYAETNQVDAALADLNRIRKRADATAPTIETTDQQALIDEILLERRRELCFEGHLFFDLARKKRNIVRVDCISENANLSFPDPRYAVPKPFIQ